jgi:hypothetical protein
MTGPTDWYAWHDPYDDPTSPLSRRLDLVRRHVAGWLDEHADGPVTVVSACAGQGRDLLGVLAGRADSGRVRATLVEYDERNVAAARAAARAAGLDGIEVRRADAGRLSSYAGAVPADLVLLVGVLGNISDGDVHRTVRALPRLCAPGATVIWTRTRRAPDLTPALRGWFAAAGFAEVAFEAPDADLFTVGVHRLATPVPAPEHDDRLFTFVR